MDSTLKKVSDWAGSIVSIVYIRYTGYTEYTGNTGLVRCIRFAGLVFLLFSLLACGDSTDSDSDSGSGNVPETMVLEDTDSTLFLVAGEDSLLLSRGGVLDLDGDGIPSVCSLNVVYAGSSADLELGIESFTEEDEFFDVGQIPVDSAMRFRLGITLNATGSFGLALNMLLSTGDTLFYASGKTAELLANWQVEKVSDDSPGGGNSSSGNFNSSSSSFASSDPVAAGNYWSEGWLLGDTLVSTNLVFEQNGTYVRTDSKYLQDTVCNVRIRDAGQWSQVQDALILAPASRLVTPGCVSFGGTTENGPFSEQSMEVNFDSGSNSMYLYLFPRNQWTYFEPE